MNIDCLTEPPMRERVVTVSTAPLLAGFAEFLLSEGYLTQLPRSSGQFFRK